MIDFERDIRLIKSGNAKENLIYQKLVGLKEDLFGPQTLPSILHSDSDITDTDESKSESESDHDKLGKFINSSRPKNESVEDKKVIHFKCFLN